MKIDHVEGAILVGGASSRMGRDKTRIAWNGVPMVRRVADALASCLSLVRLVIRPGTAAPIDLPCIEDVLEPRAAMVGLHAALRACERSAVLVTACDLPEIEPRLVLGLLALVPTDGMFDVVVPRTAHGYEPLLAIYRPRIVPQVEHCLREGAHSLRRLLERVETFGVPETFLRGLDPELRSLRNINRPEDLGKR